MLRDLYTEAGWAGIAAGRSQLRTAAARKMVTKSSIDWEGWEPGDADAAAKLIGTSKAPGLKNLLDGANVTIKGIEETRYNDLAGVLARSVSDGLGVDETAKQIDAMFDKGADWADMVARTETARAVTAGTLDSYADAGVTKVEWLTADGGCAICGEYESMGPVEMDQGFGDVEGPPAHPNCLCTLLPVLPEGVIVEEPEIIFPDDEIAAEEINNEEFDNRVQEARSTGQPMGTPNFDTVEDLRSYLNVNAETLGLTPDEISIYETAYGNRLKDDVIAQRSFSLLTPDERKNITEYVDTVRRDGTVMVAVRHNKAEKILQEGNFTTTFEVGNKGEYYRTARAEDETKMFDIHPNVDAGKRPIYGYIGTINKTPSGVSKYGDIRFELKPDVKDRTTMVVGDSLTGNTVPIPMKGSSSTEWDAFRATSTANNDGGRAANGVKEIAEQETYYYNEAQIMDGVSIDDISAIWIPKNGAELEEYAGVIRLARELNIPIVQGTHHG